MDLALGTSPAGAEVITPPDHGAGRDVILIRHGRYADPAYDGYRFIGRTDPELDAVGMEQALALREELQGVSSPIVIASPLRRALQTARIALPDAQITVNALALEIDFGQLEGLDFTEALAAYPAAMQRYPELDFATVGGENRPQLIARATRLLEEMRGLDAARPVILVSHAYFLDAFCAVAENEPRRPYSRAFQHCVPVRMQIRI